MVVVVTVAMFLMAAQLALVRFGPYLSSKSLARAMALAVAVIIGSLAFVAMISPLEAPSSGQTAPPWRTSDPTPSAPRGPLTGDVSVPVSSPDPVSMAQAAAQSATAATPGTNADTVSVSTVADGQLRVTSEPSGARVTLNGIGWGETPLTIEHLSPGMKTLRVTKEGCTSQERVVDIRGSRPAATLHVTLKGDDTCF